MAPFLTGTIHLLLAVQAGQATVTGMVRDAATDEPVRGAIVVLTDLDRSATTGAEGRYVLRDVPAGPQHLAARHPGYTPRTLHAFVPPAGVLEIGLSLQPEPIALRALEVRPPVLIRGAEAGESASFPDREISIGALRNHPLLAEADAFQALGGGAVILEPETPDGVHIRGGASDQTAYLLDGLPILGPFHAAGVLSAWNPDALADLQLAAAVPSPGLPAALSGVVMGVTRSPGSRFSAVGSVSTTQARITIDGPLGPSTGAGYLLSLRTTFPGAVAPKDEASYLRGETGDRLAKVETPLFGGRLRLLGYDSDNELTAAATAGEPAPANTARNAFDWHSRSLGGGWVHGSARATYRLDAWRAEAGARALWTLDSAQVKGNREDMGMLATLVHAGAHGTTGAGLRLERSSTSYDYQASHAGSAWQRHARTPIAAMFVEHASSPVPSLRLDGGISLASAASGLRLGPRAQLRWSASRRTSLSGSYARQHQYAQGLRNPESVVGTIFPADLWLGAGAPGVPVARGDQIVVAAEHRPRPGVRLGVQAYRRSFAGLLLVAPRGGEPFATDGFATGDGAARGVAFDLAASSARYGVVASHLWQRVVLQHDDGRYIPDHGAAHLLEAGVVVFPGSTTSIRAGVTGALGRRTTALSGGLEWESCNLLDQRCEFGGSPRYRAESLGATRLPPYIRLDLGARKHWHLGRAGRNASLALFGTLTNLLGRSNVLTYARDGLADEAAPIEMRPTAPLVVGLDWRF